MRFEIRSFFHEIELSPSGLTQPQNKVYTFAFHGLACITIQCVRYYIGEIISQLFQGGGSQQHVMYTMKIPGVLDRHLFGQKGRNFMAKRIFMILFRANTERQLPIIRQQVVSVPLQQFLKILLCVLTILRFRSLLYLGCVQLYLG